MGQGPCSGNFVPLSGFDNWLHLLVAIGMIALALILTKGRKARTHA